MKPLYCVISFALGASEPSLLFAAEPAAERAKSRESIPTAQDQSNAPGDLETTRAIRRALVKDAALSTAAKNVQVITKDGKVTLRGAVRSAQEKDRVLNAARQSVQGVSVDDRLEVSNKP